jgi:hypothetical protein
MQFSRLDTTELNKGTIRHFLFYLTVIIYIYTGTDVIEIYRIVFLLLRKHIRRDIDENNFYLYFLQNTDQRYMYHIWSLSPHAIQI